jgi:hypothetical protein
VMPCDVASLDLADVVSHRTTTLFAALKGFAKPSRFRRTSF